MATDFRIRPYQSTDRAAVRDICCATGWLGDPIDPYFSDREAFADFLTAYYTDHEPESCLVAEQEGIVVGYLLACTKPDEHRRQERRILARAGLRVLVRLLTGRYDRASRAFLWWLVFRGRRETPPKIAGAAHFHFNMLPQARVLYIAEGLLDRMLKDFARRGVEVVYGQMVITPGRRDDRLFERFGWTVLDRREVTKYRAKVDTPIYSATIARRVDGGPVNLARTAPAER